MALAGLASSHGRLTFVYTAYKHVSSPVQIEEQPSTSVRMQEADLQVQQRLPALRAPLFVLHERLAGSGIDAHEIFLYGSATPSAWRGVAR